MANKFKEGEILWVNGGGGGECEVDASGSGYCRLNASNQSVPVVCYASSNTCDITGANRTIRIVRQNTWEGFSKSDSGIGGLILPMLAIGIIALMVLSQKGKANQNNRQHKGEK